MEEYEYLANLNKEELIKLISEMLDFEETTKAFIILEEKDSQKALELGEDIIKNNKGDTLMIKLNPKINKALLDINFIKRYESLSKSFNNVRTPVKDRLHYFDWELIIESINRLGYAAEYEPKEKYFKIKKQQIKNYTFAVNFILYSGMVDIVWIVEENNELILGLPLGEFSRLMISPDYKIKKLIFGTYEDLAKYSASVFRCLKILSKHSLWIKMIHFL